MLVVILLVIVVLDRSGFPKQASAQQANRTTLIAETPNVSGRFFLVDTEKQIICCYSYEGNRRGVRLLGARKYDVDLQIPTELAPNTSTGFTRKEIEDAVRQIKP